MQKSDEGANIIPRNDIDVVPDNDLHSAEGTAGNTTPPNEYAEPLGPVIDHLPPDLEKTESGKQD